MKEIKNDGGPAFPVTYQHEDKEVTTWEQRHPGMTLRDWFAGMALPELLRVVSDADFAKYSTLEIHQRCAAGAYIAADAMLSERNK